jgi:hypothetical protein
MGLCSPEFQKKLCCAVCCLVFVVLGIYFLPTLATNMIAIAMAQIGTAVTKD